MIVNRARQLCSGIHKVQEEGVGQEIYGHRPLNEGGKYSWSYLRFIARSLEGWRRFVDNLCL
jgi:hypothetical protein